MRTWLDSRRYLYRNYDFQCILSGDMLICLLIKVS